MSMARLGAGGAGKYRDAAPSTSGMNAEDVSGLQAGDVSFTMQRKVGGLALCLKP